MCRKSGGLPSAARRRRCAPAPFPSRLSALRSTCSRSPTADRSLIFIAEARSPGADSACCSNNSRVRPTSAASADSLGNAVRYSRTSILLSQSFHRVARQCIVFAGAENQAHRRIFAGLHPVFAREIAIKIHLADVGVNQFGNFQVNDDAGSAIADGRTPSPPETIHGRSAAAFVCRQTQTRCRVRAGMFQGAG